MSSTRIFRLLLPALLLSLLAACSGNGAPSDGDIETALEDSLRFKIRQQFGSGKAELDLKDVESKDCIAKGEQWICNVSAKIEMKILRNGRMESQDDTMHGDITMTRTENGWEASE